MNAKFYQSFESAVNEARTKKGRPMTYVEKIIAAHQVGSDQKDVRGATMLNLRVDRVALQDATAQMALHQFILTKKPQPAIPTSIHCDHLIQVRDGAAADLKRAGEENAEVYKFLFDCSQTYGIDFWAPGSGIIHQTILENYALPGSVLIGTDSHTPNAGGGGVFSCGAGGGEAAQIMAGQPWEVLHPYIVGVHLTGELSEWCNPKDVITFLCSRLTVKGGTNKAFEYFGPGVESISCTGRATICNMGAEVGATTSVFPVDQQTIDYLVGTGRAELAAEVSKRLGALSADAEVLDRPGDFFDQVIEINLSELQPFIVGPHTPDRGRNAVDLFSEAEKEGWPTNVSAALIGSCTNSSISDLHRVAAVLKQLPKGQKLKTRLLIAPGSESVLATIREDGTLQTFLDAGAEILCNACGICIGNWDRTDMQPDEVNVILSSFNRNFKARNDGSPATLSFLTSPEVVAAMAITGSLDFNQALELLKAPTIAPNQTLIMSRDGFHPGVVKKDGKVEIAPDSERLQALLPFPPREQREYQRMKLLGKLVGKTTTDHISKAGPWLKFRGHLPKISQNMLLGGVNAFTGETGKCTNQITGETGTFAEVAQQLQKDCHSWVIVGDENYGEGSSREHAAMSVRLFKGGAVIVKGFARIHETNLKIQGVLPLTFVDPLDYDKIEATDNISIPVETLAPGKTIVAILHKANGTNVEIPCSHTLTGEQIQWFWAGSVLNYSKVA